MATTAHQAIIGGHPHNKVLAVELFVSQRARGLRPDDPEQWRLHAATSLLSPTITVAVRARVIAV